MGQKVEPRVLRLGINKGWNSLWYNKKNYKNVLKQDVNLVEYIKARYKTAGIASVGIERSIAKIKIVIRTNKPGIIIGRGGAGLEDLKKDIERKFLFNEKLKAVIDVKEIKTINESAQLLADDAAFQLEKRVAFRRIMKMMLDNVMQNRNIKGIKIQMSGRLGGAEMARVEWLSKGNIPLHTLKANVDFAKSTARTTYGAIGVKVWLNKDVNNVQKKDYKSYKKRR
jgi:small subunit ribosomal protein S3